MGSGDRIMKHTELSSARISPCVRLFIESLLGLDCATPGQFVPFSESEAELAIGPTSAKDPASIWVSPRLIQLDLKRGES